MNPNDDRPTSSSCSCPSSASPKPVAFERYVNADDTNAALDALIPAAIKDAANARAAATRSKA